jgi:hypothetical protein
MNLQHTNSFIDIIDSSVSPQTSGNVITRRGWHRARERNCHLDFYHSGFAQVGVAVE